MMRRLPHQQCFQPYQHYVLPHQPYTSYHINLTSPTTPTLHLLPHQPDISYHINLTSPTTSTVSPTSSTVFRLIMHRLPPHYLLPHQPTHFRPHAAGYQTVLWLHIIRLTKGIRVALLSRSIPIMNSVQITVI